MQRLHAGLEIAGRYWLVERIAVGGMGEVWEAGDATLQRRVAIKLLQPHMLDDEVFAKRFREEALMAAGLSHVNVATLHDYGSHEDLPFLVMELVPGDSLADLLKADGPLEHELVRSVLAQVGMALGAAQEAGVVHRDIKPANIMLTPEGIVKLTDFGIARTPDAPMHTQTGELIGTPWYMSPEQAKGATATAASDLYALGVVAHELLTGARPFTGATPIEIVEAQVGEEPPPLPDDVPSDIRAVVERLLAKDPQERFATGQEVAEALTLPTSTTIVVARDDVLDDRLTEGSSDAVPVEELGAPPVDSLRSGRMTVDELPSQVVEAARAGHVHWSWLVLVTLVALVAVLWVWRG